MSLKLHVETFGAAGAPTVVLLHGSGAPPDSLRSYAEALGQIYRVLLPHRNGYAETPYQGWEPDAEVDALIEMAGDSFSVVGHSFGSYRAFQMALTAPDRVAKIAAIGPVAGLPEAARESVEALVDFIRSGGDLSGPAAQRWLTPGYLEEHPEVIDTIRGWLEQVEIDPLALENLEILDGGAVLSGLRELEPELHLYVGELDQATPPELARALDRDLSNTTLHVEPGMSHLPMLEDFEGSLRWLREALSDES